MDLNERIRSAVAAAHTSVEGIPMTQQDIEIVSGGARRQVQLPASVRWAVAVAATTLVLVALVLAVPWWRAHPLVPPNHHGGASAAQPTPKASGPCANVLITCLGGHRYRVALPAPVIITLPANFQGAFALLGSGVLEDYRTDIDSTGVTVMENAIPVKYDASWSRDPAAGSSAASMARWLSQRPFLVHATLTQTTVGGRISWRVTANLKPGAQLPAIHGTGPVAPTFTGGPAREGYNNTLLGEYTLLDVPGGGVTVIWSWNDSHNGQALAGNQTYVDDLSFG